MTFETLLVDVTEGIATVTLNRPEARNALNAALVREPETALKGVGDGGTTLQARESFSGLPRILEAMARMRTPLIAQVHGFALAARCGLAVGCDIVVAAEDAMFGLPEIRVGVRAPLSARAQHPGLPIRGRPRRRDSLLREAAPHWTGR